MEVMLRETGRVEVAIPLPLAASYLRRVSWSAVEVG